MFQTKVVEKIKTLILSSIIFFLENLAVCGIMWKNIVDRGRPQRTITNGAEKMRFACRITKETIQAHPYNT
jgi:hypothetical protein